MKNIIILGSGRSGTSMVAGCFAKSGYFIGGEDYIKKRGSNLKGFFESREVNSINEEILYKSYPKKAPFLGEWIFDFNEKNFFRWISKVPLNVKLFNSKEIVEKIKDLLDEKRFCFKDPRFSYTLPIWKPYLKLKECVFICVFRHPSETAFSILKELRIQDYLKDFFLTYNDAIEVWKCMYSHILKNLGENENWIFLHYNQLFEEKTLKKLEKITGANIDYSFPDKKLNRNKSKRVISGDVLEIYQKLCVLAGYGDDS